MEALLTAIAVWLSANFPLPVTVPERGLVSTTPV